MTKKQALVISLLSLVIISLILFIIISIIRQNNKLSHRIAAYYENINKDSFEMDINNFTNYKWDYLIVYQPGASTQDINQISDIKYTKYLDLSTGIIFVKGNKIVYEETFKTDFESPYKFVIYPYENTKVSKITRKNAKFIGKKIKYDNDIRLAFYPIAY